MWQPGLEHGRLSDDALAGARLTGPTLREVLALFLVAVALTVLVLTQFVAYEQKMLESGDKLEYGRISEAIREWSFEPPIARKYFWGFPLASAAAAAGLRISDAYAMLVVSALAALVAVVLVFRLWGGTVAALFVVASPDWLQQTALGGAEPVFAFALFAGFLLARQDRWLWSAAVLSYATLVRPVGVFALLGLGVALLMSKRWMLCSAATALSLAIGVAYLAAVAAAYGDPAAHFAGYGPDWTEGRPVGLPFVALGKALLSSPPLLNVVKTSFWILASAAAMVVAFRRGLLASMFRAIPVEAVFACCYVAFLFTYDSAFAWSELPRFLLPVLPFVFAAFSSFVPRGRWFYWAMAVVSGVLAGASAVNVRHVVSKLWS
ncbi:MAG: hypothetical protein WA208_09515 [Thermoanaerobaculia bacterium]